MEEKQNAKVTQKEEKKVTDKKPETEGKKETKKQEAPKDTKKKFENKKGEAPKIDNKIIIGVVAAVVVIIAILACVIFMSDSPKKAVESMLRDLKSGNYDQEMIGETLKEESLNEDAQKLFFDQLAWKIQNVKTEGDKATVEVEITNKDFKTIIGNYMQTVLKKALSGETIGEDEMTNYLIEELKNDDIEKVTSNQSIVLEKVDGKWKATEENNNFADILLPGFNEAISSFN